MKTQFRHIIPTVIAALAAITFAPAYAEDAGPIDAATAVQVMTAAQMSRDVSNDKATLAIPGWTRVEEWQAEINKRAPADFYAAIYKAPNGDITIAYRSSNTISDFTGANIPAAKGETPYQYEFARQLAILVKQKFPNATISVTGYSLGGALATYAAQQVPGIANVTTFSAPRPPIVSAVTAGKINQINIVARHDYIGDPRTNILSDFNPGYLPGKTYEIDSTTYNKWLPQDTHSLDGIIGGLEKVVSTQTNFGTGATAETKTPTALPAATPSGKSWPTPTPATSLSKTANLASAPTELQTGPSRQSRAVVPQSSKLAPAPDRGQQQAAAASSTPIGQSRPSGAPIVIKVPGIVDGRPTMVDMPIPTNAPVNAGTSRSDGKAPTATAAVTGTPAAVGGPVAVAIGTPVTIGTPTTIGRPIPIETPNVGAARAVTPGGISLSRAAADRMPLEIALDASALSDGKIVLSGRASKTRMDAALFLTALRAACDDRDPYFSLDPDDGTLWSQQGEQASNEFWERIEKDYPSNTPARARKPGVNIRTVSATQDYPGIWHDISPHYPNFRAKLVFYPEWLRQTRLGEVLYKADVLLKELSSGVSILVPGKLRASAIPGYLSADVEYAAKSLLAGTRDQLAVRPKWRGSRLWFEIAPSELPTTIMNEATTPPPSDNPALRSLLQSKGLIRSADQSVHNASFFMRHGSVFDLSQVNPIMFVRVHDHATNKDLSDHDPRLDGLAADVSTRFDQYAQYYDELGLLREVFRAYIAARKITEANDRLCGTLDAMPLLDSEKLAARLPDYHPSELFVTIASYSTVSGNRSQTQFVKASSMSGGVSIAGQKFAETAMRDGETTITRAVEIALAGVDFDEPDRIESDRKFISFIVDDASRAPVHLVSNARDPLAPRSLSDYPIENEPPAASRPAIERNQMLVWIVLAILAFGFAVRYRSRRGSLRGR
jgi:hypothetical protein